HHWLVRRHRGTDRCDETIAPAIHCLDKPWRPGLIAQYLAELPDGDLEHRITHHRLGPDCLKQRVFGHKLARLLHQAAEDCKGFRMQRDYLLVAPQPFVAPVQAKGIKHHTVRCWQGWRLLQLSRRVQPEILLSHTSLLASFSTLDACVLYAMQQTFRILSATFQHFFSSFSGLNSPGGARLEPQEHWYCGQRTKHAQIEV